MDEEETGTGDRDPSVSPDCQPVTPWQHPDLVELDRRLESRLERVLAAEQEAAAVLARRTAFLRDRLLDAEDACAGVTVEARGGVRHSGRLAVVAADHIELLGHDRSVLVSLDAIVAVTVR